MNTDRRSHIAAFALALVVSVSIFSGVSQLAAPSHADALLVQATTAPTAHS